MTWILGIAGILCIIVGIPVLIFDGDGSVFVGGWILLGLAAVVEQLSAIRKILKKSKGDTP